MAGSNGSPAQRGGQPPQWPVGSEEQARALEFERWQHQQRLQAAQQGRAAPQAPAGSYGQGYTQLHHPQAGAHPEQGYDPQYQPPPDSWSQDPASGYQPHPQAPAAPEYAAQFERFSPAAPQREAVADPFARFEPAAQQPAAYPDPRAQPHPQGWAAPHDPRSADPRGFDVHGQPYAEPRFAAPSPGHPHPGEARADVQSWDLSHYAPGQIPQGYAGAQPAGPQQGWPPQQGHAQGGDPHWQQPAQAYWPAQAGQQPGAHPGYEPPFDAQHPGMAGHAYDEHAGDHDPGYDSDDMEPVEDERRGPSTLVIVAALLGAIVAGGGLAYGYKMFGGGLGGKGQTPVLRADAAPAKMRPENSGGMQVEHSDKKFLNRLSSDGQPPVPTTLAPPATSGDVDGSAKKVPTITINVNRDNTITPNVVQAPPSEPSVPGLIIDGPPPGPAAAPPPPARQAVRMPPPPPPIVRTAQAAPPAVVNAPAATQTAAETAVADAPKAKRIVVPKKHVAAVRDDLLAPKSEGDRSALGSTAAAAVPRHTASASSGFVAVLASKQSRQAAIATFPDLHQKYPDLLGGKTPDVREVDLRDKGGIWYRLVVGPPGSRQAANTLCAQLKERGMKDCWAAPY